MGEESEIQVVEEVKVVHVKYSTVLNFHLSEAPIYNVHVVLQIFDIHVMCFMFNHLSKHLSLISISQLLHRTF